MIFLGKGDQNCLSLRGLFFIVFAAVLLVKLLFSTVYRKLGMKYFPLSPRKAEKIDIKIKSTCLINHKMQEEERKICFNSKIGKLRLGLFKEMSSIH